MTKWRCLLMMAFLVGCQPAQIQQVQDEEQVKDPALTQVPEALDKDFVKLLHLMNAFNKDKIDIKQWQAEHALFAKEYNTTGTIARDVPQTLDELLAFERINAFLSLVAEEMVADKAVVYVNNDEITQIFHRPKPEQNLSLSYYLIDGEPVLAKAVDERKKTSIVEFYLITPDGVTLVADSGKINWQGMDDYKDCNGCYNKAYRVLDAIEHLKRQSTAQKQQSDLTNSFQSRNNSPITLENSKQLDDYPKNSLVVGHYPDGKVGQVFYSFGDDKSNTSYGYYFENDKLVSIDKTFIAYLPDGNIDQSSRIKKQWYIKDDGLFFNQDNEAIDLPAQQKQVQRLIGIAHQGGGR